MILEYTHRKQNRKESAEWIRNEVQHMKKTKKLMAILLALVMVLSLLPISALAAEDETPGEVVEKPAPAPDVEDPAEDPAPAPEDGDAEEESAPIFDEDPAPSEDPAPAETPAEGAEPTPGEGEDPAPAAEDSEKSEVQPGTELQSGKEPSAEGMPSARRRTAPTLPAPAPAVRI